MHKLGVVLLTLSVIAIAVIAILRAPIGWLLIPAGVLAVWLFIRIVMEEKTKRDMLKKIKP